jgi:hypothetical protein
VLRPGDVIVAIDGVETLSDGQLRDFLTDAEAGQEISVEILRENKTKTVSLVLGAGVEESSAPMIGVMITTAYEELVAEDVPVGKGLAGAHSRLALIGGDLYALDPVEPEVVAIDLEAPELPWLAAGGTLYRVEGTGSEAMIVGHDGTEVPLAPEVTLIGLLGSLGDGLVVAVDRGNGQTIVALLDTDSGELVWAYRPQASLGEPIGTISDVDASRLIVGLVPADSDSATFQVLSGADGSVMATADLAALSGGRAFGWFDDHSILGQGADSNIVLVDTDTGDVSGVSLPVPLRPELRVWAVGDGTRVLIQDGNTVLSAGLGTGVETRPLVARCQIDYIDQIGTGQT